MGSIIVLFELGQDEAIGAEGVEPVVLAVHAAGSGPGMPEEPLPHTLCGLGTGPLEQSPYRPVRRDEPWYPPPLADLRCRDCEAALRTT
ncbi:hypothetical protein ACWEQL_21385 [Kitasatospora sp. NPDC004240]